MKRSFAFKMIAVVLTLTLVFSMAACGSDNSKYAGTYKMESIEEAGELVKVQDYIDELEELLGEEVEFSMTLTLGSDGSFKMASNILGETEEAEGSWTADGDKLKLTIDGETEVATYEDGKLTMEMDGTHLIFAK